MKRAYTLLVTAIVATTCLLLPAKAEAATWNKWGVAPFASSFEEACAKAPAAIDAFKLPKAVKEAFKEQLGTSCVGRNITWLTPGMILEDMWSGSTKKKGTHRIGPADVAVLPVPEAPDGHSYPEGSVAETAKALSWKVQYEGKTYVLYLPFVCFNWAWATAPEPLLEVQQCVTVEYTVKPGDEVRFAVLAKNRLPSSACWQLCDGTDCAAPPAPCDTCNWNGPKSVIPTGFEPFHTGKYPAHAGKQTLRLPVEAGASYVALCVTRGGVGESDSWIVQPKAWGSKARVTVPYGGQEWPAWGKVDMSKWH